MIEYIHNWLFEGMTSADIWTLLISFPLIWALRKYFYRRKELFHDIILHVTGPLLVMGFIAFRNPSPGIFFLMKGYLVLNLFFGVALGIISLAHKIKFGTWTCMEGHSTKTDVR